MYKNLVAALAAACFFSTAFSQTPATAEPPKAVLKAAFDKIHGEHHSMSELRAGSYLRDVYAKYGVL